MHAETESLRYLVQWNIHEKVTQTLNFAESATFANHLKDTVL